MKPSLLVLTFIIFAAHVCSAAPYHQARTASSGNNTFYIHPEKGDDHSSGKNPDDAWKTSQPLNAITLAAGDKVIISPGKHTFSFDIEGSGTKNKPITLVFEPGFHDFTHGELFKSTYQISNTNDDPKGEKAVLIHLNKVKNINIKGYDKKSTLRTEGKAIYIVNDHTENVAIEDLSFDYIHPTMGEFHVTKIEGPKVYATIPEGTLYEVKEGKLRWHGPGWEFNMGGYAQICDTRTDKMWHANFNPNDVIVEELAPQSIVLTYKEGKTTNFQVDQSYQNRHTFRDYSGVFQNRSKNISWKNCNIHYIHGLGIVSQFCDTLTYDGLKIAPTPNTLRTNASWADCLHFSGCKGKIEVKNSTLGSAHDDPINIHGTHLRIIEQPAKNKLLLRFMHGQTFGFEAFAPGDEIDYVHCQSMIPYASNKVKSVKMITEKDIELTLEKENPKIGENDVIENTTWTPSVHIHNNFFSRTATRGVLVTTRKPILIENNTFYKTGMHAILSEGDALFWFESGVVRDMTIQNNRFIECAEPVIKIEAPAQKPDGAVHSNIRILNNEFMLNGQHAISTKHTSHVKQSGNTFMKDQKQIPDKDAVSIHPIENNK